MLPKYIKSKQVGNKGEAFFESLFSDFAIIHKVDSSKDIGLDFLCEWVCGQKPTQLLFGVQVKTRSNLNMKKKGKSRLNALEQFEYSLKIKDSILNYWRGFDFPIFLFLVNLKKRNTECFYKRYTPILHGLNNESFEKFYKVNNGTEVFAFIGDRGGFCRDLFIDHLRCQHYKGMLSGIDPHDIGLTGYDKDKLYQGVWDNYKTKIEETFKRYQQLSKFFLKS